MFRTLLALAVVTACVYGQGAPKCGKSVTISVTVTRFSIIDRLQPDLQLPLENGLHTF